MKAVTLTAAIALQLLFSSPASHASTIQLPQTGQTRCYDTAGAEITCAGSGQDGDKLAGAAWPDPRFTDNSDGTVTDNLTGLVWLKNADCFAARDWQGALNSANSLADGACSLVDGSVAGDWRLPNPVELGSLLDLGRNLPAIPAGHPFGNVKNDFYWTSSTYAEVDYKDNAWIMDMTDGYLSSGEKAESAPYVWPVRNTKALSPPAATVQLPQSGQKSCWDSGGLPIACAGTGQDGDNLAGVAWPDPRFTDNGNGTVTDNLTGLVWLTNANCFGLQNWQSALNSANTLASGTCSLSDGSKAGDWRLPNRKEMQSLIDFENSIPALPTGHPFNDVKFGLYDYYWASSSITGSLDHAWLVDMYVGYADYAVKSGVAGGWDDYYVWPVRDPLPNSAPQISEGDSTSVTISKNGVPTSFSLTLHATDADSDTLIWSISGAATNGTAVASGSGASIAVSYTPVTGYVGSDSFVVQVSDGKGGLDSITVNVTITQTCLVSTAIIGSGSMTPDIPQIFNIGASTTFVVNAGAGYYTAGVSGCGGTLTGNSYATGTLSADCTVTSEFRVTQARVPANSVRTDFNTLQEAYADPATSNGMTIQTQAVTFSAFTLDRDIDVTIKGGYDSGFTVNNGVTLLSGSLTLQRGSAVVENLTIL